MPQIRKCILTGLHRLHILIYRTLHDGKRDKAITAVSGEDEAVSSSFGEGLTCIHIGEVITANIFRSGTCRIIQNLQGNHHRAVATVHSLIRFRISAGRIHHQTVIVIRQGVGTGGYGVIMQIGRMDVQRQRHNRVAAIGLFFHDVIHAGGRIAMVSVIDVWQGIGTDGDCLCSMRIRLNDELDMVDAIAVILAEQFHIIAAGLVEDVCLIESVRQRTLANSNDGISFIGGMNHQGQMTDAVTTGGRCQVDRVLTGLCIGIFRSVVPEIRQLIVAY